MCEVGEYVSVRANVVWVWLCEREKGERVWVASEYECKYDYVGVGVVLRESEWWVGEASSENADEGLPSKGSLDLNLSLTLVLVESSFSSS